MGEKPSALRLLRVKSGLKLRELSARTGINISALSQYERGLAPVKDHTEKILAVIAEESTEE